MIRFALAVASVLGFVLTAALGNLIAPLLQPMRRAHTHPQHGSDVQPTAHSMPGLGGLCLAVGTLAATGVGWTAACIAQQELLGSDHQLTARLLAALLGAMCFGAVGLADDLAKAHAKSQLGLRSGTRLLLEVLAASAEMIMLASCGCLPMGITLPGGLWVGLGIAAPVLWVLLLVLVAECARIADGADGTVCGCAFVAMLGLMCLETRLSWFPLAVLPAALAGTLMAFLLWNFPPARLHPGSCGSMFAAGVLCCVTLCIGEPQLTLPLALPFWAEGGMVALQVLAYRMTGKTLFSTAPLHHWLAKHGCTDVQVFYRLCALSVVGMWLALWLV